MQRLSHAIFFFLIVCGVVISDSWAFVEYVRVGSGSGTAESAGKKAGSEAIVVRSALKDSQKDHPNITYSWFLEDYNEVINENSIDNNTRLTINDSISYQMKDEDYKLASDISYNQKKDHDFLYLNEVGIWVKFHDYAPNVDILLEDTEARNASVNSKSKYEKLLENQTKENRIDNNSLDRNLSPNFLRRNREKDGLIYSFFQVISQDWLLGWSFICNYFKEFILK